MNWKHKAWKYATAFVVVLIMLNPEMNMLALFVDAVGLEMFLLLLEIQVSAILGTLLIEPSLDYVQRLLAKHSMRLSLNYIMEVPESYILAIPTPATLMHMIVFSAAIGISLNECY